LCVREVAFSPWHAEVLICSIAPSLRRGLQSLFSTAINSTVISTEKVARPNWTAQRPRSRLPNAPTTRRPPRIPLCIGANMADRMMTRVPTTTNVRGRRMFGR
jgi:hypothetical protein